MKNSNIAATLLKLQERKTAKGNSYAVLKLTDLSSVFELFIFSDVLELNREILKEGNSLILNLVKNITDDENRFKRINVQKISSLKELFNSPINEVCFEVSSKDQVLVISKILKENGKTIVNINLLNDDNILQFKLRPFQILVSNFLLCSLRMNNLNSLLPILSTPSILDFTKPSMMHNPPIK